MAMGHGQGHGPRTVAKGQGQGPWPRALAKSIRSNVAQTYLPDNGLPRVFGAYYRYRFCAPMALCACRACLVRGREGAHPLRNVQGTVGRATIV